MTRLFATLIFLVGLQACSSETGDETGLLMLVTEYTIESDCTISNSSGNITYGQSEDSSIAVLVNNKIQTDAYYFIASDSSMGVTCEDGESENIINNEKNIKNIKFINK